MGNMIVTMADGSVIEVSVKPSDIVQFERKFDVPISQLNTEQRYEWLLYLAWLGAKRNGATETYDKWIEQVEVLDLTGGSEVEKKDIAVS